MKRAAAIARLTFRGLVRSRLLLAVAALVLAAVAILPFTIEDDGTLAGRAQILIRYTTTAAAVMLSVGTLAVAPGTIASELQDRRLHLVMVKPVRPVELWVGKWAALVAFNAIVLGGAVALSYALMMRALRPGHLAAADRESLRECILVARESHRPLPAEIDPAEVRRLAEEWRSRAADPAALDEARLVAEAGRQLRLATFTAGPGGRCAWTFDVPRPPVGSGRFAVRFRFDSSAQINKPTVRGEWAVSREGGGPAFRWTDESRTGIPHEFAVPAAVLAGGGPVTVSYANREVEVPASVVFPPQGGVEILVRRGGYEANLVRAALIVLCQLALLSAIGVSMGALFSPPVAVFTSLFCLAVLALGGYIHSVAATGTLYVLHHHGPGPEEAAEAPVLLRALFAMLDAAVSPVRRLDPLDLLAEGRLVPWTAVRDAVLSMVVGAGVVLAGGASWALRRRELAQR